MTTKHNLTIETRLDPRTGADMIRYFDSWRSEYGKAYRFAWYHYARLSKRPSRSAFNTQLQRTFGITKRTANSIIFDVTGRYNALLELKKTEASLLADKISTLKDQIELLGKEVSDSALLAAQNKLSEDELVLYRGKKRSLYFKKQRMKKKRDQLHQLESDIREGKFKICFGTRKLLDAQNRLHENGFHTHDQWYRMFAGRRDANIVYLGSKDETACNQMFQLTPLPDGAFCIKCRKDGMAVTGKEDRYVLGACRFPYMADALRRLLSEKANGITYRVHFEGKKVYLQAILSVNYGEAMATTLSEGAIGLDYNDGFIQLAETDRHGNLVHLEKHNLAFHGTGTRAENEIRQTIAVIARYSLQTGKSIVCENLNFKRTKGKQLKGKGKKGKRYNRMTHLLDYSRYKDTLKNAAVRNQIDLIMINPAYTSRIASKKYCTPKKLNIHAGAAYVIARRGQGFKDKHIA